MTRKIASTVFGLITSLFILTTLASNAAQAQTTAFTYQGRFSDTTVQQPTNGNYNMTFRLFDAATGGNQIPNAATQINALVTVTNSLFTVRLDFGAAAFNTTAARYLEIQVGQTVLAPRQEITSTPFSQRSLNAANADSLGGVAANQYVQTNDARLSDSRTPTAGSANYIQNGTMTQPLTNFNISGDGVVGGKVGIGTTVAPTTASLQVNGGVLARGGAPGNSGASNNGYAFSGNSGDTDSGMFSTADGTLQFYTDNIERLRLTQAVSVTAGNGSDGGNTGGAGAGVTLQGGNGGFGLGTGGAGAGITLRAGNGGASNFAAGNGASITLQPGTGGTSSNQTPGTTGNVILAPTNGNVGIGTTSPTSKLYVNGTMTVTGTINGTVTNATNADTLDNLDSTQFIRNQTAQQAGNFNISGNGTVGGNLSATGNVVTNGNLFAVGGGENLRVVRGIFQVSNGTVTIVSGSGFTVTRNSVGNYSINFTTAFSNLPSISPSVVSGATIIGTSALGVSGTTITAFSPNGSPGDPTYVMFIAIGPK